MRTIRCARGTTLGFVASLLAWGSLASREAGAQEIQFRRGDSNGDGRYNISDPIATLSYLFLGTRDPSCLDASDVDDSGTLNITDPIYSLTFLFLGGVEPRPPGPIVCGADPSADALGCAEFPPCSQGSNQPPLARFSASVQAGLGPLDVVFDASSSIDPDGSIVSFAWDFGDELDHHIITRRLTRGLRAGEPAFYETRQYYDADGQLTRRVFPEGNEVRFTYDAGGSRGAQGNLIAARRIAGPRGSDGAGAPAADLVTTFAYEPLFNQLRAVTDPRAADPGFAPPLGVPSAGRYTTRFFFDYQESSGDIAEAAEFGIDLSEIERGLGDLNGDGRTAQAAGDIVRSVLPAVELLSGSNEALARGTPRQDIVVETQWNDRGQLLKRIDPEGNVTVFDYHPGDDPDGDGEEVFSPFLPLTGSRGAGYLRSSTLDAETSARRRATAPPAGLRTTYSYDPAGNVVAVEDARGVVTRIEVSELNETVAITRGAEITGAAVGQILTGEEPLAHQTRLFYDHNGRVVRSEVENRDGPPDDPDPAGLGDFVERTFTYDLLDDVVEATAEADSGAVLGWQYRYDPNQLLTRVVLPEGNVMAVEHDERNLLFRITRGLGAPEASTSRIDYDRNGNRLRLLDAEDNDGNGQPEVLTFVHDGFDRQVEALDALGNRFISAFDPNSNVVGERVLAIRRAGRSTPRCSSRTSATSSTRRTGSSRSTRPCSLPPGSRPSARRTSRTRTATAGCRRGASSMLSAA